MIQPSAEATEKKINTSCYHCGDVCLNVVALDDKLFCCQGCKMVYSILHEHNLSTFYDLNEAAGSPQHQSGKKQFDFLDDENTVSKLISFQDEHRTIVRFYIPQIHCSSCLWLLENLHQLNPGVKRARVNFLKKEVQITFAHEEFSLRELAELLGLIGYPPHIILGDLLTENRPTTDRSFYYKLGLAGFAFGNIMLLSFPEYFGLDMRGSAFELFLSYIIIGLALPVVFYSGSDYFLSAWQGLKHRHLNIDVPVSLGISVLFFRSLYEILSHSGPGYLDSMAGLIFFLLIGKWFQQTTYARVVFNRDYSSYFPIACTIIKNNRESQITLDKLDKGDHVIIRHGELIPADACLINGEAEIDYGFVTGESELIQKSSGEHVFAGGRQMGAIIEIAITKKVSNSYLTQLWNDHAFDKTNKGSVSALADRVASVFTWTILLISALTLLYWLPKDASTAVNAFTAVLIIACPCAVALSIPFTFGNVIRLFAREKIYFKNIHVIETLAKVRKVIFDKTGTLTSVAKSELIYKGKALTPLQKQIIVSLARQSSHPLSRQLFTLFDEAPLEVINFHEEKGKGLSGTVKGIFVRLGSATFLSEHNIKKQGTYVEIDHKVLGSFDHKSQYRPRIKQIISALSSRFNVSLLSGDNNKEQSNLLSLFDQDEMYFNHQPKEKLQHVRAAQQLDVVAMIGDGLNDAGALSQSDVGIVITENSSNFTPASDIIMEASQFDKLPLLFSFSRLSIRLVYVSYAIALVYNFIGLYFAVQGLLSPVIAAILMPLSSITIVLFGVLSSSFFAWVYGVRQTQESSTQPLLDKNPSHRISLSGSPPPSASFQNHQAEQKSSEKVDEYHFSN